MGFSPSFSLIIFAHGSASSRHSPRNRFVADVLRKKNLATLFFDLLTPQEEQEDLQTREYRFDIPLLTDRLILATRWSQHDKDSSNLPIGFFGASTGAAAALRAAAHLGPLVKAVVSRGGRPDLAIDSLPKVTAPTLLIVGTDDPIVIDMNKHAAQFLIAPCKLLIIPHATHLFEEPGALEKVAHASANWFASCLV